MRAYLQTGLHHERCGSRWSQETTVVAVPCVYVSAGKIQVKENVADQQTLLVLSHQYGVCIARTGSLQLFSAILL